MSDYVATWSTIIDDACDWQYPPKLNYRLNRLLTKCMTDYSLNGCKYTTKKVDPYTAIETNNTTGKQRTLKSSVRTLILIAL